MAIEQLATAATCLFLKAFGGTSEMQKCWFMPRSSKNIISEWIRPEHDGKQTIHDKKSFNSLSVGSAPFLQQWHGVRSGTIGNHTGWNGVETRSGLHPLVSTLKLLRWDESQNHPSRISQSFDTWHIMTCIYQNLRRVSWGIIRHISSSRIVPRSVASWFKTEGCRDCSKSTLLVSCECFLKCKPYWHDMKGKSLTRQTSTFHRFCNLLFVPTGKSMRPHVF